MNMAACAQGVILFERHDSCRGLPADQAPQTSARLDALIAALASQPPQTTQIRASMSLFRRGLLQQRYILYGPEQRRQCFASTMTNQHLAAHLIPRSFKPLHIRLQTTYAQPAEPARRSVIGRLLRSLLSATVFVTLGIYIGWETLPSRPAIAAILSPAPSDTETLSMYQPPDAISAEINAHITRHVISEQLRKNAKFSESRPHLKIPEIIRSTNLTGGTLAGPGRLVVPPLVFSAKDGSELYVLFYLGEQLCGHPGIVHGGMLATLLDEGLARCCFPALPNKVGVTANLKVNYRKPTKAADYYLLKARTTKVEGRKAWVIGWIERLDGAQLEESGEKFAEAEALFVEPRNAQVMKRMYQTA